MVHMSKSLGEHIPSLQLPEGFVIRGCQGEPEVAARAKAQYGAFESKAKFERYVQRFTNFMRSPVYDPELDIVAVSIGWANWGVLHRVDRPGQPGWIVRTGGNPPGFSAPRVGQSCHVGGAASFARTWYEKRHCIHV